MHRLGFELVHRIPRSASDVGAHWFAHTIARVLLWKNLGLLVLTFKSIKMSSLKEIYISQSLEQSLTPPETPPHHEREAKVVHPWPEPETAPEEVFTPKRRKTHHVEETDNIKFEAFNVSNQEVLLLHGPKQKYTHTKEQPIPRIQNDREMLVAVEVVGLNPIDWKAP